MKYYNQVIFVAKEVYSQKKYIFLTLLSSVILLSLNALVRNYQLLWSDFSFSLMLALVIGLVTSFTPSALVLLITLSLLGGIVISWTVFLLRRQVLLSASLGLPGIIITILAPACPSCALGLVSIFGIGGILAFLPLKGVELGIVSIILLLLTIIFLSKKISTATCDITKKTTTIKK